MSPKSKDGVRISRETAEIALTELNYLLDYADDEREIGGERELLADAQDTIETDGLQAVEGVHEAENGEQVVLHYDFFTAYKSNEEGAMDEIDLFNNEQ